MNDHVCWECVSIKPALHSSGIILSPSCWAYGPLNLQGHTNTHTHRPKLHFTCINKQRQIAEVKDTQRAEHSGRVIFDVRLACFSFLIQPERRCVAAPADRRAGISTLDCPKDKRGLTSLICAVVVQEGGGGTSNVNALKVVIALFECTWMKTKHLDDQRQSARCF